MTIKGQNELPILRVAKPCTEDWEQMVGDDRVRYCAKCELSVYNFADMTRDEIAELVARREGRICGRLYRRQDGTVVTKDCNPEVRAKYGDLTRWAAMALSAAMSVTMVRRKRSQRRRRQLLSRRRMPIRHRYNSWIQQVLRFPEHRSFSLAKRRKSATKEQLGKMGPGPQWRSLRAITRFA